MPNKLRLLLVDDDADMLALLEIAARRCGAFSEISLARDGEQALLAIDEIIQAGLGSLPDIIISDLRMPMIDGAQLAARLKANDRTKHIHVIVITSSNLPMDREAALRAGCDGFYLKPSSVTETAVWFSMIGAQFAGVVDLR